MTVGCRQHGILSPNAGAIAMQNKHQGGIMSQTVGQINGEVPHVAIDLEGVIGKTACLTWQRHHHKGQ
jgi:hypothetical protein